jgi:hypothetical protein
LVQAAQIIQVAGVLKHLVAETLYSQLSPQLAAADPDHGVIQTQDQDEQTEMKDYLEDQVAVAVILETEPIVDFELERATELLVKDFQEVRELDLILLLITDIWAVAEAVLVLEDRTVQINDTTNSLWMVEQEQLLIF